MNILLVYTEFEPTFWGQGRILKLIGKKAPFPPVGLLTVAAMLPDSWEKRLVDIRIRKLTDADIRWADYVFISAMLTQSDYVEKVIKRCEILETKVVLGGPILEKGCEKFPSVAHFFLGEVENTLQEFVTDLEQGVAKRIYPAKNFPNLADCPIPMWKLINSKDYACMLVQWGRGCPFRCTFCNIKAINGCVPRVKSVESFLQELDAIYKTGFRGRIMFCDDNFIGNVNAVREMLPWLIRWQQAHGYPFSFTVEVDVRISDDKDLMYKMVSAGFRSVFLGIETPNEASLEECGKTQNLGRDLVACIKKIHSCGLVVFSGFIIGFDSDGPNIFAEHLSFYRRAGICIAMSGMLMVGRDTKLYEKMEREGRLLNGASGNNTDWRPNFVTRLPLEILEAGYKWLWRKNYSPEEYFERMRVFLDDFSTDHRVGRNVLLTDLRAFIMSIFLIGFFGGPKVSWYYWKTLSYSLGKNPRAFSDAVALLITGWQLRKIGKGIQSA